VGKEIRKRNRKKRMKGWEDGRVRGWEDERMMQEMGE